MIKAESRIDMIYGKVRILGVHRKDSQGRPTFKAQCECGRICYPRGDYLNARGKTVSCGCRQGKSYDQRSSEYKKKRNVAYIKRHEEVKSNTRRYKLKEKYRITPEIYSEMFLSQKGRCLVCKKHRNDLPKTYGPLAVDHCHKTGKIRGLLCRSCNSGIGHLKDDVSLVYSALLYLSRNA